MEPQKIKEIEDMNRKKALFSALLITLVFGISSCQKKICPTFKLQTLIEVVK